VCLVALKKKKKETEGEKKLAIKSSCKMKKFRVDPTDQLRESKKKKKKKMELRLRGWGGPTIPLVRRVAHYPTTDVDMLNHKIMHNGSGLLEFLTIKIIVVTNYKFVRSKHIV
jgi:hypothetical protein